MNNTQEKKKRPIMLWILAGVLLVASITTVVAVAINKNGGIGVLNESAFQESEAVKELRQKLADESITTVEITEELTVGSTLEVVGTKTIKGNGVITAANTKDGEGYYILTIQENANVVLENVRINGQNIAGGVHITKGANTKLAAGANVCYAANELANVFVEGECVLDDASLLTAGGHNVINSGTMKILDGEVSGSGTAHQYAGILNSGELTMEGGAIEKARTNVLVQDGGVFTFAEGEITESIADGIAVEKGGTLYVTSAKAKINNSRISAMYICGKAELKGGEVNTSTEAQIEIGKTGEVVIHNMTARRSYSDGIYNEGTLTIENIDVSTHTGNGIVNRGTLVMKKGAIHDNDGEGVYNRAGGTAELVSSDISIYNNHTGVVNHEDSIMELAYAKIYDNTAYSVNNYGTLDMHDLTCSNSGSTSIYGNAGGNMTMKNVVVDGTIKNHGMYVVAGSTVDMTNVTIKNTEGKGIANKGGIITGNKVVVSKAGTEGVANVAAASNMTINNLTISGSKSYNLQNSGESSVLTVIRGNFGAVKTHSVRNGRGTMTLTDVTIDGVYLPSGKTDSLHAIYSTAEKLNINNCTIKNVEKGRGIHNRGTTLTIKGLVAENVQDYVVANVLGSGDYHGDGVVNVSKLKVVKPQHAIVLQETPGGEFTIADSALTCPDGKNIIVNNRGTMKIESGVDLTCRGRAINNKGTMIINGGTIHDIKPSSSTMASGILNTGKLTINDCQVYNNIANLRGVITNTTGTYDYNQDGKNETLYGTITINGGQFYNNKVTDGKNNMHGGALYINGKTTAVLNGGYFYNNTADGLGNDIYNAGNTTIGRVVVGYDVAGKAYEVESMAGEFYTTEVLRFAGTAFGHGASKLMNVNMEDKSIGTPVIKVSNQMQATVKAGISVKDLPSDHYLSHVDGNLTIWKDGAKHVCKIGSNYYYSLNKAIESVANGATANIVILEDIEMMSVVEIGDDDGNTKHITLIDDGNQHTISRGEGLKRFFRVYKGSSLTLTTTDKSDAEPKLILDGTGAEAIKDAQIVYTAGTLTVEAGVVLQNNKNTTGGGAVNVATSGKVTMNGGLITGNETTENSGGAFYVNGTVVINDGSIADNKAKGSGGAFWITKNGTLTIKDGTIANNAATTGGAIAMEKGEADKQASTTISGGNITGNTASGNGGAVNIHENAMLTMTGGTISGNNCTNNPDQKGIRAYKDTSILKMSGLAYADYIYLQNTSTIELTGELTTENKMTILCSETNGRVVINKGNYTTDANITKFQTATGSLYDIVMGADGSAILHSDKLYVLNKETGIYYASINDAVKAVADEGSATLVIQKDIEHTALVEIGDDEGVTKDITIIDGGTKATIKRGDSYKGRFFRVYGGSRLTLTTTTKSDEEQNQRLVLDGTSGSANRDSQFVYVNKNGTLIVDAGVVIKNNKNTTGGGAISVASDGIATINGGLITDNQTTGGDGGAIYVNGTVTVKGGTVTENKCGSSKNGGAFYVTKTGNLTIEGGTISKNKAKIGGAIATASDGSSSKKPSITITGGTITGNTATGNGGGINVHKYSTLTMTGGIISGNDCGDADEKGIRLVDNTSVLKMSGSAYADYIFLRSGSIIELTGNLTTIEKITVISGSADPFTGTHATPENKEKFQIQAL